MLVLAANTGTYREQQQSNCSGETGCLQSSEVAVLRARYVTAVISKLRLSGRTDPCSSVLNVHQWLHRSDLTSLISASYRDSPVV
eukprot:7172-Heterococcus_DN1.PRE.1